MPDNPRRRGAIRLRRPQLHPFGQGRPRSGRHAPPVLALRERLGAGHDGHTPRQFVPHPRTRLRTDDRQPDAQRPPYRGADPARSGRHPARAHGRRTRLPVHRNAAQRCIQRHECRAGIARQRPAGTGKRTGHTRAQAETRLAGTDLPADSRRRAGSQPRQPAGRIPLRPPHRCGPGEAPRTAR